MKRNERLNFKIDGEDVSPETVSFADLSEIVKTLEMALAAVARSSGERTKKGELTVSLVGVAPGSDNVVLALPSRLLTAAGRVSRSLASNNFVDFPVAATKGLRRLWKFLNHRDWTFGFVPDGNGVAAAQILPDVEILKPNSIRGRTTVYGKCERVGGATRQTMRIRLLTGEACNFVVKSKSLAQKIGTRLHTVIGVEGEAWWEAHTLRMQKFVADNLLDYNPTSPKETFSELAKSADGFWDTIDPDEYVKRLRSD
jgi:hypothetical protein